MATEDRRLDISTALIDAAKAKVERRIQRLLRDAGVQRPRESVINRDILSIAAGAWAPLIAKELAKLGLTEKPTGKPRQRAIGVAAGEALDAAAEGISVRKADLIRAGLKMLAEKGLPEIDGDELNRLLEVEDERLRFRQRDES